MSEMTRFQAGPAKPVRTLVRQVAFALALLCVMLWAPNAHAYPSYDDGTGPGQGCVQCHTGFLLGNGPLHLQHRTLFGVTSCNICHPSGGGSTPVLTYWSGSGGFGCAGCHGQNYGETSPNSLLPKATAYGLRQLHVNQGVTSCGTGSCHTPGALGHPNPFPILFGENVLPPYFAPAFSSLTDPCVSAQEDLPFDIDSVGLDNDGDGAADWPADNDCPDPPTPTATAAPTPTPTPIPPATCGATPIGGCDGPGKGIVLIKNETENPKDKLLWKWLKGPLTVQSDFGNPMIANGTNYTLCIYDDDNLKGSVIVSPLANWSPISTKGYKYKDPTGSVAGITKVLLKGGDPGKSKILVKGKGGSLPQFPLMFSQSIDVTVQLLRNDDPQCWESVFTPPAVKTTGTQFKDKF